MARQVARGRFNGLFPYGLSLGRTKDKTSGGQALAAWLYGRFSHIYVAHPSSNRATENEKAIRQQNAK